MCGNIIHRGVSDSRIFGQDGQISRSRGRLKFRIDADSVPPFVIGKSEVINTLQQHCRLANKYSREDNISLTNLISWKGS